MRTSERGVAEAPIGADNGQTGAARGPRVLVLHLSIGGGHSRAAEAAARAIEKSSRHAEVALLDVQDVASPLFKAIYRDGYLGLVKSAPRLWGALYAAGWRTKRGTAVPQWLRPACVGRLAACVDAFAPDVMVATAAPVSALLSHLRATALARPRLVALLTDYHAHPSHVLPGVDRFLVAAPRVAAALRRLGADPKKIRVTGIPVDEAFAAPVDPDAARATLGVRPDVPVVLVMGGALGSGRILETIRALGSIERPLEILAVAGRNRRVEQELRELRLRGSARLHAFGYTSLVPELMAAANLFVTKPGGVSTTEALAHGLPMVFVDSLHGQESRNRAFFVREGCAVDVRRRRDLAGTVERLLDDEAARSAMSERARAIARPDAAAAVAAEVLAMVGR